MANGFPENFLFVIAENPAAAEAFRAMGSQERQALFQRARPAGHRKKIFAAWRTALPPLWKNTLRHFKAGKEFPWSI